MTAVPLTSTFHSYQETRINCFLFTMEQKICPLVEGSITENKS